MAEHHEVGNARRKVSFFIVTRLLATYFWFFRV